MSSDNTYYCCPIFQYWLEDPYPMFFYDASNRVYAISMPKCKLKKSMTWPKFQISFCPVCGEQFPSDLTQQRADILRSEYDIDNPLETHQQKLIPKEFMTDEWWKKRGL